MAITPQTDFVGNRAAILSWFETYSGLGAGNVIWANPIAIPPAKPYATLSVTRTGERSGLDEQRETYNGITQRIERVTTGLRKMRVSAVMVTDPPQLPADPEAVDLLEETLLTLETLPVMEHFRNTGMAAMGYEAITQQDVLVGSNWERRAQAALTFHYTGGILDDGTDAAGDWIETAPTPSAQDGTATYSE